MPDIRTHPRLVAPRYTPGVDHGSEGLVLVRDLLHGKSLVWRYSCKAWQDRLNGYQHEGGRLLLCTDGDHFRTAIGVTEDGHLSKARLMKHAKTIDYFFGVPVTHLLHVRKTLVIYSKEP